jgi:O-antigen/teichoic acid export membrane protein
MSEIPNAFKKQLGSLRDRVFQAGSWTLAAHFSALVLRFISSLIMTRIFSPEIFGILALMTAVQVMVNLFTDIGLHQAIIQSQRGNESAFLNTAWTLQILRGLFIWLVGSFVALGLYVARTNGIVPQGSVYSYPNLPSYLVVILSSAIILGFQSMRWVTASRELDVKRILLIEFLTGVGSLVLVVIAGWITRSIWAYVGGMIFSATVAVLFSHTMIPGQHDRIGWDRAALAELSRFGRWTFFSSTLSALAINGDRLLLGGLVSAQVLGQYSVAYSLASVPDGIVSRIFGTVVFPALSEAARNQPKKFSKIYFKVRSVTDASILFVAGLLFSFGPVLVRILYDSRYEPSAWMLQYMSVGLIFARYTINQNAYLALGKPQYLIPINVIKLVSLFGLTPLLYAEFGTRGAILGISAHMLPATLFMIWLNNKHRLNNWRFEIGVSGAWLFGWLLGCGLSRAYNWLSGLVGLHHIGFK